MVLAAQTTTSTAGIWAIVIVAVVVLAFWLMSIYMADRSQVRASGRARTAAWPSYAGPWARAGTAAGQTAEIPEQGAPESAGAQGGHATDEQGEAPTRSDIPAQPAAGAGRHAMPVQRTGDADRPEHSHTGRSYPGQGTQEDEDRGQGR